MILRKEKTMKTTMKNVERAYELASVDDQIAFVSNIMSAATNGGSFIITGKLDRDHTGAVEATHTFYNVRRIHTTRYTFSVKTELRYADGRTEEFENCYCAIDSTIAGWNITVYDSFYDMDEEN